MDDKNLGFRIKQILDSFEKEAVYLSSEEIFIKISEFDSKYTNNLAYIFNIGGVIGNIASQKKDINLVSSAIARLKKLVNKYDNHAMINKLKYDLALCLSDKGDFSLGNNYEVKSLLDSEIFLEAIKLYYSIPSTSKFFKMANVNMANLFDRYGRYYESIMLYDKILDKDDDFGMAIANKALALIYYYKLTKKNPGVLLDAVNYLEKAIRLDNTSKIGGPYIIDEIKKANEYYKKIIDLEIINEKLNIVKPISIKTDKQNFFYNTKLYLNLCFDCKLCNFAISDNLFTDNYSNTYEILTRKVSYNSTKLDNTIVNVINQIYEDYSLARELIWIFQSTPSNIDNINTYYVKINGEINNSLRNNNIKRSFAILYNILDKIAYILFYYCEIDKRHIHFIDICEYEKEIIQKYNFQFLSLFSMSKDFSNNGIYFHLRKLRNNIVHNYLNFTDKPNNDNEIREEDFINETMKLFNIVKSAMIYLNIALFYDDMTHRRKWNE